MNSKITKYKNESEGSLRLWSMLEEPNCRLITVEGDIPIELIINSSLAHTSLTLQQKENKKLTFSARTRNTSSINMSDGAVVPRNSPQENHHTVS